MNSTAIDSIEDIYSTIHSHCKRPAVAMRIVHVLGAIVDDNGSVGPVVSFRGEDMCVREALARLMRARDSYQDRTDKTAAAARAYVTEARRGKGESLEGDEFEAAVEAEVENRQIRTVMKNLSSTMTDLEAAGLVKRHYMGNFTGHPNRGGHRNAVYSLSKTAQAALNLATGLRQYDAPLVRPAAQPSTHH